MGRAAASELSPVSGEFTLHAIAAAFLIILAC
jgi:hypothetical protein